MERQVTERESSERLWRCIKCGCDYVSEVPHCGALNCGGDVVEAIMLELLTMSEDEFRGRVCKNAPEDSILHEWEEFDPDNYAIGEALRTEVILGQRCKRCGVVKHRPFSLSKAMANGGKCLAGDRPARIVCTDRQDDQAPLVVLVFREDREIMRSYGADGKSFPMGEANESRDLRNLPEYQEAEVLLWYDPSLEHPHCWEVTDTGATPAALTENAKPWGPPVKVEFPKG